MRMLERFTAVIETAALLGPVILFTLFATACMTGFLLLYRLLTQGYYRFFFSSR